MTVVLVEFDAGWRGDSTVYASLFSSVIDAERGRYRHLPYQIVSPGQAAEFDFRSQTPDSNRGLSGDFVSVDRAFINLECRLGRLGHRIIPTLHESLEEAEKAKCRDRNWWGKYGECVRTITIEDDEEGDIPSIHNTGYSIHKRNPYSTESNSSDYEEYDE